MPMKRKVKGRYEWYGKVMIKGRTRSKRCRTRAEAVAWEESARLDTPDLTRPDTVSIGAVVNRYVDDLCAKESRGQLTLKHTREAKDICVGFANAVGPRLIAVDIPKALVRAHLDTVAQDISNNRANVHRKHLKRLMQWAFDEMEFPRDWLRFPPKYRRSTPVQRPVYTVEEFWKIHDRAIPRFQTILLAFLETGARRMELFRLRWKDVNLADKTITLTTRKRKGGTESDVIPISDDLTKRLKAIRLQGMESEYVFLTPWGEPYGKDVKLLLRLSEAAKVPYKGFHGIRRLSASLAAQHGGMGAAYAIMRHKDMSTTDKYVKSLGVGTARLNVVEFARAQAQ